MVLVVSNVAIALTSAKQRYHLTKQGRLRRGDTSRISMAMEKGEVRLLFELIKKDLQAASRVRAAERIIPLSGDRGCRGPSGMRDVYASCREERGV